MELQYAGRCSSSGRTKMEAWYLNMSFPRPFLGLREDAPLTGRHEIQTEAQAAMLSPFLDQPLDLAAYDYIVDYYFPREGP